jgi:anti-sigma regulatory factor (Ser/Thr protein kinase)
LDGASRYQVKLAMSEAVTNAIQHGSSAPEDRIEIAAVPEPEGLAFEVRDTGRFIPRVMRGDEMAESGRGLDFMRLLMDDVQLHPSDDGTLLRFTKRKV